MVRLVHCRLPQQLDELTCQRKDFVSDKNGRIILATNFRLLSPDAQKILHNQCVGDENVGKRSWAPAWATGQGV